MPGSTLHGRAHPETGLTAEIMEASGLPAAARLDVARYAGTYLWDPAREEMVFWTAAESGELHRGRAWLRDGILWHEAEVAGGRIAAYASAMRRAGDNVEYFAAYGTPRVAPELHTTQPLVYTPRRAPGGTGPD